MIEPRCPECGKPMRLFVVDERFAEKDGHYECIDCPDPLAAAHGDDPLSTADGG
jgi:hypothetical protein